MNRIAPVSESQSLPFRIADHCAFVPSYMTDFNATQPVKNSLPMRVTPSESMIEVKLMQSFEYAIPHVRNTIRNHNRGQTSTTGKCRIPDTHDTIGESNRGKTAAILERIVSDVCHVCGDCDRNQAGATGEHSFADTRHAARDYNGIQSGTAGECPFTNACHTVRIVIVSILLQPENAHLLISLTPSGDRN